VARGMHTHDGGASSLARLIPWSKCGEDGGTSNDPWLLCLGLEKWAMRANWEGESLSRLERAL
jgi:hypothetical protein